MTLKEHKKHAEISRPRVGQFGRFELGLIGAPCGIIKSTVLELAKHLTAHTITYIDADHSAAEEVVINNLSDKITRDRIDFNKSLNPFDRKILLSSSDILMVNGNHFPSEKQIVFCTEQKRESLFRKVEKLTDVGMIILGNDISIPHEFLESSISNFKELPVFKIQDIAEIANWIKNYYSKSLPVIKGLVLAGGQSLRMGQDKSTLEYHGLPQIEYVSHLFEQLEVSPYISYRTDQGEKNNGENIIRDTFEGLGPFGAILSAFREDPNSAWISIACDQPLLKAKHLKMLIEQRDPSKFATCFHNPETGFPEPLITLWEPKAYARLLSFLAMGYSCPRKVLINSDVKEIHLDDTNFMKNANTQEERQALMQILNSEQNK